MANMNISLQAHVRDDSPVDIYLLSLDGRSWPALRINNEVTFHTTLDQLAALRDMINRFLTSDDGADVSGTLRPSS